MKKMEKKKKQKQKAIILAAQEIFKAGGYVGSSMDVIAQKAGVTKQTLYRYFQSKEILFQASLEAQRKNVRSQFLKELDREDIQVGLTRFAIGFLKVHMSEDHIASIRLLLAEGVRAPAMARAHFEVGPKEVVTKLTWFFKEQFQVEDPSFASRAFISTLLARRMDVLIGLHKPLSQKELEQHVKQTVRLFVNLNVRNVIIPRNPENKKNM